jgi:2-oxoglutarate ferredoxin oxidoreductase subunit alpha
MEKHLEPIEEVTIRFAGDSGDGMQLAGTQFSNTTGIAGNEMNTFPDYPSEIRAPEGTLYGVSAFQIHFGSKGIHTTGDRIDVLVAMNASSLKVNIHNLRPEGLIICNEEGFDERNLKLAAYTSNPLTDQSLASFRVLVINFSQQLKPVLSEANIPSKFMEKTRNMFALGITYWLFNRPLEPTLQWIQKKFEGKDEMMTANLLALKTGWNYAATSPVLPRQYSISRSNLLPGTYRNITGNEAVALALVTSAYKARLPLFLGSYPITPATEILQAISKYKRYGVKHLQAEDEIAGITSAIGAAFGGSLAATTTSGPGLSLKSEALGLAVMVELPLIIVDVQRAGPSTGLPTKTEQGDLLQAFFGRHGEAPLPILAPATSADCFATTLEAARIALKYMTPVIVLSDGYIGQASEPWRVPDLSELPEMEVNFPDNPASFAPYKRDEHLSRPWAIPGIKGMEHRVGGLEKAHITGEVSHDPVNHERMVRFRADKIKGIANDIPKLKVHGNSHGPLLLLSWGSTYGAARTAYDRLKSKGVDLSFANLRYLNPFPSNLGEVLGSFKKIVIPELNMGQLRFLVEGTFLKPVIGINKVQGRPFKASELEIEIQTILDNESANMLCPV